MELERRPGRLSVRNMNFGLIKAFVDRLSVRTKLIAVGVIFFLLGTFWGGRGSVEVNGHYVPWGENLLDTRTGQVYIMDGARFKKGPSPGWF